MKKSKKGLLIIFSSLLIGSITSTTALTTSCVATNAFTFGNFESYISPDIIDRFNKGYENINWYYYNSNKQINNQLVHKTLNAVIPTNNEIVKLVSNNLIEPIPWKKFELLNPLKNDGSTIESIEDLKPLYTDLLWTICENAFKDILNQNLLTYCIPYFLQNVVFVYRGDVIPELEKQDITFSDIFNSIATNSIFKNNKPGYNVMMIDDQRLLFDIAKILKSESECQEIIDINPESGIFSENDNEGAPPISYFQNTFKYLEKYIKNKNSPIGLQSDSNILINKLARNEIKGAFVYNGDAAFAAIGGDYAGINQEASNINADNFHIVVPKNNIIAMDGIVINKKNDDDKKLESFNFAFNLSLSGLPTKQYNPYNSLVGIDKTKYPSNTANISKTIPIKNPSTNEITQEYLYSSMINFDYVNYTPPLKAIMDLVTNGDYFDEYDQNMNDILIKILNIQIPGNDPNKNPKTFIEMPLSNLTESNLNIAYLDLKS